MQMVVVSAGIKPRDDLARDTDIAIGERGGIVVDEQVCFLSQNILITHCEHILKTYFNLFFIH